MQTVSASLGHKVGEHRAARMIHHLQRTRRITQVSRYKGSKHGYWITVYRLHSYVVSSVRRKSAVKTKPWWQHGLFGNPDGAIPVGASEERLERWKSKPWRWAEAQR